MLHSVKMLGSMLILRRIAATHLPANHAQPQMHPSIANLQAFLATLGMRLHILNLIHVRTLPRHILASKKLA
jgi:hypothetical protein